MSVMQDDYDKRRTRPGVASPQEVANFHERSDSDVSKNSQHHTLGPAANQSSPGNHNHDGTTSTQLLAGVTISGAKGGNIALASVIAALVTLGATDSSTA